MTPSKAEREAHAAEIRATWRARKRKAPANKRSAPSKRTRRSKRTRETKALEV